MTDEIKETIESWPVENIRPYEGNAKVHTPDQVANIAKSIKKFGFDQPIVVDGAGVIIKGHGRWMAAQSLGMKHVPVIIRDDLTAHEANASRLADNRVAVGDVDTNLLNAELERIASVDEELLNAMGFTEKELEFMTKDLGDMDTSALTDTLTDSMNEAVSDALSDSAAVAGKRIPIKDVFGFTHVDGSQAKILARWFSALQGAYADQVEKGDPAGALVWFASEHLGLNDEADGQ